MLSEPAPDYESQLRAGCVSARNRLVEWGANPLSEIQRPEVSRLVHSRRFVEALAEKWAARGVANDPNNLSRNWAVNGKSAYYAGPLPALLARRVTALLLPLEHPSDRRRALQQRVGQV